MSAKDIARWRLHPDQMVREIFGVEPDPWQLKALQKFPHCPRMAMKASKGVGKTCLMAWLIWNFMLTRYRPIVACVSIDWSNLTNGLWTELARWRYKSPLLQSMFIQNQTNIFHKDYPDVWFCAARSYAKSSDKNEQAATLSGLHSDYIMFVLDETGGMSDGVMVSAENALSTAIDGHIVQAGNPTHLEGPLYNACSRHSSMWEVIEINSDPDNPLRSPRVSIEWAKQQISMYGRDSPWVLINVFGQFPPSSLNALIGPDEVRAAMKRYYRDYDIGRASKVMGVDVARFGDDSSVIACRHGRQMMPFKKYRNLDSIQGAGTVTRAWEEFNADACFIDNTGGFGSGWLDQLRELGRGPIGIHFAGKPHKPERFANKRAEMYFDLCEWIKEGGALPECDELISALTSTTYSFTKNNLMILEPKEVVKSKLNGASPDEADAAALTFAELVSPSRQSTDFKRPSYSYDCNYNPFKEESLKPSMYR